jgi:hypothetical protein
MLIQAGQKILPAVWKRNVKVERSNKAKGTKGGILLLEWVLKWLILTCIRSSLLGL